MEKVGFEVLIITVPRPGVDMSKKKGRKVRSICYCGQSNTLQRTYVARYSPDHPPNFIIWSLRRRRRRRRTAATTTRLILGFAKKKTISSKKKLRKRNNKYNRNLRMQNGHVRLRC